MQNIYYSDKTYRILNKQQIKNLIDEKRNIYKIYHKPFTIQNVTFQSYLERIKNRIYFGIAREQNKFEIDFVSFYYELHCYDTNVYWKGVGKKHGYWNADAIN